MNIYNNCPEIESERFLLRLIQKQDCDDLLEVYSDKNALPYFNTDNCDGDNFYYTTKERMDEAIRFWKIAYENCWFARLSIIDKALSKVIGTVEICLRVSDDAFNNMCILRVDVSSDYEREDSLFDIFSLITPQVKDLFECKGVITKASIYAVDRINAIQKAGFIKSERLLVGKNGYSYDGYWIIN